MNSIWQLNLDLSSSCFCSSFYKTFTFCSVQGDFLHWLSHFPAFLSANPLLFLRAFPFSSLFFLFCKPPLCSESWWEIEYSVSVQSVWSLLLYVVWGVQASLSMCVYLTQHPCSCDRHRSATLVIIKWLCIGIVLWPKHMGILFYRSLSSIVHCHHTISIIVV